LEQKLDEQAQINKNLNEKCNFIKEKSELQKIEIDMYLNKNTSAYNNK